ncbi:cyclase family protein [Novosphingobium sp. 9]|uniref:cyclase family protein n=1 Tax=Novosphingobium sp. 9 TaxID=2025349 RepID=UPI0021B4E117|nr:cyclase family protein [Novosphingobium sp. 9]
MPALPSSGPISPFRRIVDLSHPMFENMRNGGGWAVTFPLMDNFKRTAMMTDGKASYETHMMMFPEHCGTHLDAPRHFHEPGLAIDELPLERLMLPGLLLDLTHKKAGEPISIADFEAAEVKAGGRIGPDVACVCWTGVDKVWGQADMGRNRPHVPTETAQWLVDRGMTMFATDLIGMDDPEEWWDPTHQIWLSNNVCMVQQLTRLEELAGEQFLIQAFPIKVRGATGCPVRAVALVL